MKTSIIYASKTGHSKKLANAIAKELNTTALNVSSNPKLEKIDLLFVVGGVYGGVSLPELLNYIKTLDNTMVKKVALVTSSASKVVKQDEVRKLLNEKNIEVLKDEYTCQGGFLLLGFTHPNKTDIENAVSFARKISVVASKN